MCCLGVLAYLDMPTIGVDGSTGLVVPKPGIYYGVTRSERYGALVGQSEDWTTLQVYIHGMDGTDWNTSRLLRAL